MASATSVAPVRSDRMVWMDGLRGTAIVLIVVLHATEMLRSIGLEPDGGVVALNLVASPFRIPLLMLLSGMLLDTSLRKGAGPYLLGKLRGIAWPYAVWIAILLLVFPSLGPDVALRAIYAPDTYLWYLHTLLVAYLLALLLRRLPAWLRAAAPFALGLVVGQLSLPEEIAMLRPERTLVLLAFFFTGDLIMRTMPRSIALLRTPLAMVLGVVSAVVVVAFVVPVDGPGSGDAVLAAPVLTALAVGVGTLSRPAWTNPIARWLRWVGRHSIVYYVSHWITMYWVLQVVAPWLVPAGPTPLGAVTVGFALLAGAALAWLVQLRTPARFLFRLCPAPGRGLGSCVMSTPHILTSGAGGYNGSHDVSALLSAGARVTAVVRKQRAYRVDERATIVELDLLDPATDLGVLTRDLPDAVVHLAWERGFQHDSPVHMLRLSDHFRVLDHFAGAGVQRIAALGTMHEIGYHEGAIDASTPTDPLTMYGIAKDALRRATLDHLPNDPVVQWLRAFYIYGDDLNNQSIFTKLLQAAQSGSRTFPFTTGKNQFDFIHVEELGRQIAAVAMQDELRGIINVGSGTPVSLADQVERFIRENRLDISLEYGAFPDRPYDSKAVWGDATDIRALMASLPPSGGR